MAKPQHRTPAYRAAYAALKAQQAAGAVLWCVEPICKHRTRDIHPWQRASVSHDPTGTILTGFSHLTCNLSEAAVRGNKMRAKTTRRAAPARRPGNRWVL